MDIKPQTLVIVAVVIAVMVHFWKKSGRIDDKVRRIRNALKLFSKADGNWSEENLVLVAKKAFRNYQDAYDPYLDYGEYHQRFNQNDIEHLLHPEAPRATRSGTHGSIFWSGLAHKRKAIRIRIVHAYDRLDNNHDEFTACIDTSNNDLIDWIHVFASHRKEIFGPFMGQIEINKNTVPSKEFWTFKRSGDKWLLFSIHESDYWKMFCEKKIIQGKKKAS